MFDFVKALLIAVALGIFVVRGSRANRVAPGSVALLLACFAIALGVSSLADFFTTASQMNTMTLPMLTHSANQPTPSFGNLFSALLVMHSFIGVPASFILPSVLGIWALVKARGTTGKQAKIARNLALAGPVITIALPLTAFAIAMMITAVTA